MVSPVTFRHPSVLAASVVTADHASGGRVELGIGAGWFEEEHRAFGFAFPPTGERVRMLAEQIEIVHRLWGDGAEGPFDGAHYRVEASTTVPSPLQQPHPPLIVGGHAGPKVAAIAARWADEYDLVGGTTDEVRAGNGRIDDACAAIGRDPASLRRSVMLQTLVGADEAEVRDRAASLIAASGEDGDPGAYVDEVRSEGLAGTPEQVLERLGAYRAAGVERVLLQHLAHDDLGSVELIGREIDPRRRVALNVAGRPATLAGPMSQLAPLSPVIAAAEAPRLIARTPAVDAVGLEGRAAALATRSIKKDAKLWALDLAIRCMDLTTLEGTDTVGKVAQMSAKAVHPDPSDPTVPSVAAVCVYPWLVPTALSATAGSTVKVASVAGAFPAGLGPLAPRLAEIRDVAAMGAHEIDIVLNRSLFLGGRYAQAFEELVAAREAAGAAHLKVILEVGELGSYDRVRQASMLAMAAGADFIKTSTGKIGVNATLPNALCMLEAARDFHRDTGRAVGIKVAGGVRKAKQSIQYLVLVHETLGPEWMTPDRFRIGASSLLNDVLMQIQKERTGRYQGPDYFTLD